MRELLWKLDPEIWLREAIGESPDPWQVDLMTANAPMVLGLCGRQVGKSTSASWRALHKTLFWPRALTLLIAPSLRQSAELAGKVRYYMSKIPNEFQPKLLEDNKLSIRLENNSRCVSLPGDGNTVRGFSAPDLVIVDEAHYCPDDLFTAVLPMLAASKGTMIQITTANGEDGMFFQHWQLEEHARRILIKSEDCPRVSRSHLKAMRKMMSDADFKREYECVFAKKPGRLFTDEDFLNVVDSSLAPVTISADAPAALDI